MNKIHFWKNKNILITGVAGFVGSNLAKNLSNLGSNVIGISQRKNKKNSLLFYENINKKIEIFYCDITDKEKINKIIKKYKIQICFHLAAQVEVGLAKKDPYGTWESNIRGTYTLLELFRKNKKQIKSIIIASSDKAYGEYGLNKMPYDEKYPLKPIFPYDTSKACADMIAKTYASKLFNLPIIITRFSNIYGPGQLNFTALIPGLIKSCIFNRRFKMRGNGESIRDYIYINDIVDIYKILAKNLYSKPKKYSGEIFNAGTNTPYKTKTILKNIFTYKKRIKELSKVNKIIKKNKTSGELQVQYMNYIKLNKNFGWKPKYEFGKVLPEVFKWYEDYFKNTSP